MDQNKNAAIRPERVEELSKGIGAALKHDLNSLRAVNETTRILSINARIEAAHAGGIAGAAFSVIANEVMSLAKSMDSSFRNLEEETAPLLGELEVLGTQLARDVRGQRLADLAATHLDLVDRNLYERSCDVRWWATDSGLVTAMETRSTEALKYASTRMGTILDSYTVYFDLVLCDCNGIVVANGRPGSYGSVGMDMRTKLWFQSAMGTSSGTEFGFEGVHESTLVSNARVLVYSAAIRKGGAERGDPIGVLGVVFRWDALGQTIVDNAALSPEEAARTKVLLLKEDGRVLAASGGVDSHDPYPVSAWLSQNQSQRFHLQETRGNQTYLVAVARSLGYETYKTGWGSVLQQNMGTSGPKT